MTTTFSINKAIYSIVGSLLICTLFCISCSKDDPGMSGEGEGENSNLTVDFDLPDGRIYNNCGVTFTDKSTGATTYEWDFGDGIKSTDESPVHAYSNPGNYTVTLMVTKDDDTQEKSEDIQVYQLNTFRKSFGESGVAERGRSVALDKDGNYVIVGSKNIDILSFRILWTKISPEGNVLSEKIHGGPSNEYVSSMVKASDGSFVVGHSSANFGTSRDFAITKLSNDGDLIWASGFPSGFDAQDDVLNIIRTQDNNYLLVGRTASNTAGGRDGLIMKVDDSGNLIWSKTYGGSSDDSISGAYALSDGGYVLAGSSSSGGSGTPDFWLVKTDGNGIKQWDNYYGTSGSDGAGPILETEDGGYILAGRSKGLGSDDSFSLIYKLDQNGNVQWSKEINNSNYDEFLRSIISATDGGYIFCGSSASSQIIDSDDAYLFKIDENGNKVWSKTFGTSSNGDNDEFYDVAALDECTYVAIGVMELPNSYADNFLVRVDLDGNAQ